MTDKMTNDELAELSAKATQGLWKVAASTFSWRMYAPEHPQEILSQDDNARFVVSLVNAYRAGQLRLPSQREGAWIAPNGRTVEQEVEFIAGLYDDNVPSFHLAQRLYEASSTARALLTTKPTATPAERAAEQRGSDDGRMTQGSSATRAIPGRSEPHPSSGEQAVELDANEEGDLYIISLEEARATMEGCTDSEWANYLEGLVRQHERGIPGATQPFPKDFLLRVRPVVEATANLYAFITENDVPFTTRHGIKFEQEAKIARALLAEIDAMIVEGK